MHVPAVEIRNKIIKQIFRSVLHSLPYKLPKFLFKYLVFFSISRINMYPVSSRTDPTPARELFIGRKIDYKKDVRIGFGEYVQIDAYPNPRNDATKARTVGALSLDPRGNLNGSIRFYVLGSEKKKVTVVIRDSWTKMVMTPEVIDYINDISRVSEQQGVEVVEQTPDQELNQEENQAVVEEEAKQAVEQAAAQERIEEPPMRLTSEHHVPVESVPDVLELGEDDPIEVSDPVGGTWSSSTEIVQEIEPEPPPQEDSSSMLHYVKFHHEAFSTLSYKKGLKKYGNRAMDAAEKEMRQMLDQDVWEPVNFADIPEQYRKKVIISFMFLKEKFKPDGEFDKLKMRLVAGGHMQAKLDLEFISSPTVSLSAVLIMIAFAVKKEFVVVTVVKR